MTAAQNYTLTAWGTLHLWTFILFMQSLLAASHMTVGMLWKCQQKHNTKPNLFRNARLSLLNKNKTTWSMGSVRCNGQDLMKITCPYYNIHQYSPNPLSTIQHLWCLHRDESFHALCINNRYQLVTYVLKAGQKQALKITCNNSQI